MALGTGLPPTSLPKYRHQAITPRVNHNKINQRCIHAPRPSIAVGRRNWLFAGSDEGGDRAATVITILQTAKLNGINPQNYLTDVLTRITNGHPASRINELLPWAINQGS